MYCWPVVMMMAQKNATDSAPPPKNSAHSRAPGRAPRFWDAWI